VVVDDSDSLQVVTSGIGTGLLRNDLIEETFNNLSDRAQRAVITITPYTVTPSGAIRCTGTPSTIDIWVEPTARLTLLPSQDTICDGETTSIRILSPTESTLPVRFNYQVVVDDSDSLQVVTSGIGTGLLRNDLIEETFNNLSDRAQRAVITITPYTVTPSGAIRCTGTPSTIDIWVEPTARLTLLPSQDTICDGETTSIRILSPTESTLPVRFNYQVVVDDSDSLQVVTSGIGTGLLRNDLIEETFNNLSDRAQRAVITITPYTVTPSGAIRCTGTPSTIDIWVEPTARLTLLPSQDTICDGETTSIRILSPTESTLPVRFNFQVVVDDSDSLQVVTSGIGTGLLRNDLIEETFNNLSDRAQRAVITITPYTVTPSGAIRCTGTPSTIDIWVEPTARLTAYITNDTICNGETIVITWATPTVPTNNIVFNTVVVNPFPLDVSGYTFGNGLPKLNITTNTISNTGDTARMIMYIITPILLDNNGNQRCPGRNDTLWVWVNPTPRVIPVNLTDRICTNGLTDIELTSPTVTTKGQIQFDYTISRTGVPGNITGNSNFENDLSPGHRIRFNYANTTDTVHSVFFHITPKVTMLGCSNGITVISEVKVHPIPIHNIVITNPLSCNENADGRLMAILSRGTEPFEIYWTGPFGFRDTNKVEITDLLEGYYTATVYDFLGCSNMRTRFILRNEIDIKFEPTLKEPNYAYHISCNGAADAELEFWVNDGTTYPYSYLITRETGDTVDIGVLTGNRNFSNPATFRRYYNLPPGTYSLRLSDLYGCIHLRTYEVTQPEPITLVLDASRYEGDFNISCRGRNDGSAWIVSSSGGNAGPVIYEWSTSRDFLPGTVTPGNIIENLVTGMYWARAIDILGCSAIDSIFIEEPLGIELISSRFSFSADSAFNISCNGGTNGSIELNFGGGSGTYTYTWSGPAGANIVQGAKDQSGLIAGVYNLLVEDENGCDRPYSFTLTEPVIMAVTTVLSNTFDNAYNIGCFGGTGGIYLTVTGGSINNYTYNWSSSNGSGIVQGDRDQTALTAGTYIVEIVDSNGCVISREETLTQPPRILTTLIPEHITCASPGFDDGAITLTVTGGSETYTYLWSNLQTTKDLSGLTEGTYKVTVTDSYGCSVSDSIVINLPPPLSVALDESDFNGFNISCFELSDGWVEITPVTGTAPYIYQWTGPNGFFSGDSRVSSLKHGSYSVIVTDANLCTVTLVVELTQPGPIGLNIVTSPSNDGFYNINCAGSPTGTIALTPINATGAMQWIWSDGDTGSSRTGLPAGDYQVILIDGNMCAIDTLIQLTEPDTMRITLTVVEPMCIDNPNGEITVDVTGGVPGPGYIYRWNDNTAAAYRDNLLPGKYKLLVTDFNGCTATDSVTLEALQEICLEIPNAFSPNGDMKNDLWNIGMIYLYPQMEVSIFNRQGQLIWRSERGYPAAWDGRSNGRALPMDSYHYVINLHNGRKPILGNVTIVR
jgi:gliding motility-associated-like protein